MKESEFLVICTSSHCVLYTCICKVWQYSLQRFRSCADKLTFLRLLPLLGHRPRTRFLQAPLSWVIFSTSFHFLPILLMSASRSLRQVFSGLLLLRFSWGFLDRACLMMLFCGLHRVCATHLHLLRIISDWFVFCYKLVLLILSAQSLRSPFLETWWSFLLSILLGLFLPPIFSAKWVEYIGWVVGL